MKTRVDGRLPSVAQEDLQALPSRPLYGECERICPFAATSNQAKNRGTVEEDDARWAAGECHLACGHDVEESRFVTPY